MTLDQAVKGWIEARKAVMSNPIHDEKLWTQLSKAESQLERVYNEQCV